MTEVIMPKMGDGMEEGTLLEWLKKDGDAVKMGEVIGTIQTDKATLELEAPGSGKLAGILLNPGETVPVGKPIALLLGAGESVPAGWGTGAAAESAAPAASNSAPSASTAVAVAEAPAAVAVSNERVKASPLARKLASSMGVDIAAITGTGPNGRITEKDVRGAASNGTSTTAVFSAPIPAVAATAADTVVSLSRLRQITAQRTTQSKQQVPHFYVTVEVDVEKLVALKEQFEAEAAGKVSVNDFIIRASALALREMPVVNSVYQGQTLLQHGAINVGMAVALDEGLTVPVIHGADQLSVRQIGSRSRELAKKARDNKLSMDELSGSTFSISNMGMLDVDNFGAIINAPNAAILAIGTARKKVVVGENDELEIRLRMNITGSFDHRVVDGAVGARFVNLVRSYLENPTRLL
jgi:pyruvate dehydrogenase E2 component (dihydrolipoamide acetyltransferase)